MCAAVVGEQEALRRTLARSPRGEPGGTPRAAHPGLPERHDLRLHEGLAGPRAGCPLWPPPARLDCPAGADRGQGLPPGLTGCLCPCLRLASHRASTVGFAFAKNWVMTSPWRAGRLHADRTRRHHLPRVRHEPSSMLFRVGVGLSCSVGISAVLIFAASSSFSTATPGCIDVRRSERSEGKAYGTPSTDGVQRACRTQIARPLRAEPNSSWEWAWSRPMLE